jgi:hypothetical protein
MGCKNCKKIIHVETGIKRVPKYSGKKAYFVALKGYKEIELAANNKMYVFFEDKPVEAPIEFQKYMFLEMVPGYKASTEITSSSVFDKTSDTTKKEEK